MQNQRSRLHGRGIQLTARTLEKVEVGRVSSKKLAHQQQASPRPSALLT